MENKITFEEHKIIGMIAKMLNYKLLNSVPKYKTKAEFRKCHHIKAEEFLSKFKDQMEEILYKDYPKEATTDIYYGERDKSGDIINWLKNYFNQSIQIIDGEKTREEKIKEITDKFEIIQRNYENELDKNIAVINKEFPSEKLERTVKDDFLLHFMTLLRFDINKSNERMDNESKNIDGLIKLYKMINKEK
jgi:hypothetical protein